MSKFEELLKFIEDGEVGSYSSNIVHALRESLARIVSLEKRVEDALKTNTPPPAPPAPPVVPKPSTPEGTK